MRIQELCFIWSKEKKNKWRYFDCFWYKKIFWFYYQSWI